MTLFCQIGDLVSFELVGWRTDSQLGTKPIFKLIFNYSTKRRSIGLTVSYLRRIFFHKKKKDIFKEVKKLQDFKLQDCKRNSRHIV